MFDAAIIQQCADPSIEIAIVERFIAEAGSKNPLAVNISSGNRIILPAPPQTAEAAMLLIERFVGKAVVRVGITQYPAGHGIVAAADLNAGLVDPCENIRMGTALFGKVHRIVVYARGESSATVLGEAITAWRAGTFQGAYVFGEPDPGPLPVEAAAVRVSERSEAAIDAETAPDAPVALPAGTDDANAAGIRVDLSKLAGKI